MIQNSTPFTAAPKKARIEIIPLIDVIFFLLATFVLFTLSLEKNTAIKVPLPKSDFPSTRSDIDTTLYLQASDTGTVYWKEGVAGTSDPVPLNELAPRLEDYKRRTPEPRVMVRGDGTAKFGAAVLILDEVRKAKIKQASVETLVSKTGS